MTKDNCNADEDVKSAHSSSDSSMEKKPISETSSETNSPTGSPDPTPVGIKPRVNAFLSRCSRIYLIPGIPHLSAVTSSALMSTLSLLVVLVTGVDQFVIASARNLITLVLAVPFVLLAGANCFPKAREGGWLLFLRACLSNGAILLNYFALRNMPMGRLLRTAQTRRLLALATESEIWM